MIEMSEMVIALSGAGAAGFFSGLFFFGGLHWTIHHSLNSSKGWLTMTVSLLLRMSITVSVFYFVGRGNWKLMVACLVGFIIARSVTLRITRTPTVSAT